MHKLAKESNFNGIIQRGFISVENGFEAIEFRACRRCLSDIAVVRREVNQWVDGFICSSYSRLDRMKTPKHSNETAGDASSKKRLCTFVSLSDNFRSILTAWRAIFFYTDQFKKVMYIKVNSGLIMGIRKFDSVPRSCIGISLFWGSFYFQTLHVFVCSFIDGQMLGVMIFFFFKF